MSPNRDGIVALVCTIAFLACVSPAAAQNDFEAGLFCEARQLPLVSQSVEVRIAGPEAVVRLVQVFANEGDAVAQADYRLHLPEGATVAGFGFWRGDTYLAAELKEREEARQAHAAAASAGRATGLLQREGTVHSFSVYPVEAGSLQQIEVSLRLPVVRESGRSQLRLPFDTLLAAGSMPSLATVELASEEPLADFGVDGVDGSRVRVLARAERSARLAVSTAEPVDVWWAEEAPPLLARAESVDLGDGTYGIQVRVALNDAGAVAGGDRRPSFDGVVVLIDGSHSMRRRAEALAAAVGRILGRSPRPVQVVSVTDSVRWAVGGTPVELARSALGLDAPDAVGQRTEWNDLTAAAASLDCGTAAVRCLALTDPQLLAEVEIEAEALGEEIELAGLELLLLADADELAHFPAWSQAGPRVRRYQPGVEPLGALLAAVDEMVVPVLEVLAVEQRGGTYEAVSGDRGRVAEGGMMRLFGITRSPHPIELRVALRGVGTGEEARITLEPQPLFSDGHAGRAVRRGVYAALLDRWMAEYRLHREGELRARIVEVSLREGIPTDLTALHVAAPPAGRLPAGGTAAALLRGIGALLLTLGLLTLVLYLGTGRLEAR